jgi:Leucine-rich repeat (LRR) protein
LALFNNRLIDFEWLNFFKKIKYLNIGMNPIIHVPEEIFELKDLEHLNIAVTNIKYLPKEILDLNNLKKLDIKHCVNLSSNDFVLKKLISRGVEVIC